MFFFDYGICAVGVCQCCIDMIEVRILSFMSFSESVSVLLCYRDP